MRPDSLLRLWRYINHLLTYLLTYLRPGTELVVLKEQPTMKARVTPATDKKCTFSLRFPFLYFGLHVASLIQVLD